MPGREISPKLGLKPTTPQNDAGRITEPLVCVPIASGTIPAATAAAEPDEEPPGVRAGSCGLRVLPGVMEASSVVTVLPMITAPACAQPPHDRRIVPRPAAGVDRRAVLGRHVGGVDDVLHPDREAVQQPERPAGGAVAVERLRLLQDMVGIEIRPRANAGLALGDNLQARLGELHGLQRAACDLLTRGKRRQAGKIGSALLHSLKLAQKCRRA